MRAGFLRRDITAAFAAAMSALGIGRASAQDASATKVTGNGTSLVGTWKVVGATSRDANGKSLPQPYGPKGMGVVTLNADGRMMAVLCDGRTELPEGTRRDYASYCGNYTFDGTTLVTKVDASSGGRITIGSDQVRKVRFEGGHLVLTPPPAEINGVMQYRDIFWKRLSTEPA
ncbi:hypothetical protein E2C06_22090 [Dankookia rubra]|uniref:Lipocalin-like domain-containing protein n=1 Tax=Dankookia rubra TaxID=1442381 RepID=A0A4R5QDA0_9PROT|nr:lipocalin-like domain-containing protein [Dankookia rubra]TDH60431.1 hypothetical protein E2C06_22090 [Dankookia rubra]